jgi:putative DNA primase/helicase
MTGDGWSSAAWREAAREYHRDREHAGVHRADAPAPESPGGVSAPAPEPDALRCAREASQTEHGDSPHVNGSAARDSAPEPASPAGADDAEIARLARLSVLDYDRERHAAAEQLGVRAAILDRLIDTERKRLAPSDDRQGRALALPESEPWPEAVDGTALLDELAAAIRRHVVVTDHACDATALWAVHTYLLDALDITPRLAVTSPEPRCGKTTLLDVLSHVVMRPLATANTTAAAIYRVVELARPTLLIDEGDTFLGGREELRGILNSGHRRGGAVLRTVGEDHEPRQFATYGACGISLIGRLPGTLADRSIPAALQRRRADEPIEPFRADRTSHLDTLARKSARWAADHAADIRAADPEMPTGLVNRAADNWRGLLAIADAAGGKWPERARAACSTLAGAVEDDQSTGVLLLGDIRDIFGARGVDRIASAELVEALVAIEGRPWAEWRGGKPITTTGLARLLRPFGLTPENVRIAERVPKGYLRERFAEAWERYLPGGAQPLHRYSADGIGISRALASATTAPSVAARTREKPAPDGQCSGVAVVGSELAARCDHCGAMATQADPLHSWHWSGRPDGIRLHHRCEEPWYDREGAR